MKKIFLIIGRSAVGKSAITQGVCDKMKLTRVKSYTTRPMRANETEENSDHIFITTQDVKEFAASDIAAYTEINGYEYFTTFDILDKADLYVIDPEGVKDLKNRCGNKYDFIEIYIRVPYAVAKQRVRKRKDGEKVFVQRRESEDSQFKSYEASRSFHYHLYNVGTLEDAVNKVSEWIKKELGKERENEN